MSTTSIKERAIAALSTLPDDATMEDAIERLCFIAKVEEGLADAEAGRTPSHEDIRKEFLG